MTCSTQTAVTNTHSHHVLPATRTEVSSEATPGARAETLFWLGQAHRQSGDGSAAYGAWSAAVELYTEAGVDWSKDTIAYCRIGERSSHTWFVLKELLGQDNVKNYDGSWTEYGSLVGVPVALGDERGEA